MRRIAYLNLDSPFAKTLKTFENTSSLLCNFNSDKHILHNDNKEYNTLIDLIINLAASTEIQDNKLNLILDKIYNILNTRNENSIKILNNINYLKDSIDNLSKKTPHTLLKDEIIQIKRQIETINKTILNLEEKINNIQKLITG